MRLVQKTLSWRFSVIHIPGKQLAGPDTLSRIPANPGPTLGWAYGSVSDLAPAPILGPTQDGDLQEEEEHGMTHKEAKIHMMSVLRLAAEPKT